MRPVIRSQSAAICPGGRAGRPDVAAPAVQPSGARSPRLTLT
jgi:hypothetical protein